MTTSALGALVRAETRQLRRSPAALIFAIGLPLLAIIVMALIPGARAPREAFGGLSVIEAFTAPIIMVSVTVICVMSMPQTIGTHRESGFLRRLRTTPVPPATVLAASLVVHAVLALAMPCAVLAVTLLAGGRAPAHPVLLAGTIVLMSITFLAIGAVLCAVIPNVRVLSGAGNVVAILMWFSAGLWIPRAVMPDWARTLTDLTPGGASAELLNTAMAGGQGDWLDLLVCLAWTVLALAVAVRSFRWE
ncbi:ABC transporter permease [Brachybacterium hainanense]|uniref:Transport permease protein n=1 Tax=Brachybacterium hainanense TaxID=1541174 RepID=A0ABV6RAW7_9MICO